jgi:Transposase and inactivated derivatives
MEKRIPASARLEQAIADLLDDANCDPDRLSELGRLGAQLVIQRAVEEEVSEFLARARYERTPFARGWRNGVRPRRLQTGEGELVVEVPQLRGTAARFVCRTIPGTRTVIRTRPLEALVIGAYVRGLFDRDLESLLAEAGLGRLSRSSASRVCQELRDRYRAFCARSLSGIELLALFLDAIYLPTRPSGAKEGVLVAWGYDLEGKRELLAVCLGQRERLEDWLELGRDLIRPGLGAPWLVATDGAPGLVRAVDELWPEADRQRCTVHRLRNILAKLPKREEVSGRVHAAYWAALNEATSPAEAEANLVALSPSLSASTRAPPPAWPRTCRRSASTCATRCTCASGCARRTFWSARSARCNGGCASSAASPVKAAASASVGRCSTWSSPARAGSAYPTSTAGSYSASGLSARPTMPQRL